MVLYVEVDETDAWVGHKIPKHALSNKNRSLVLTHKALYYNSHAWDSLSNENNNTAAQKP